MPILLRESGPVVPQNTQPMKSGRSGLPSRSRLPLHKQLAILNDISEQHGFWITLFHMVTIEEGEEEE